MPPANEFGPRSRPSASRSVGRLERRPPSLRRQPSALDHRHEPPPALDHSRHPGRSPSKRLPPSQPTTRPRPPTSHHQPSTTRRPPARQTTDKIPRPRPSSPPRISHGRPRSGFAGPREIAPCPVAHATEQEAFWVGPCGPPTRKRVPDENCFFVRRLAPEPSRPRPRIPRAGRFAGLGRDHDRGIKRHPMTCRRLLAEERLNCSRLNHFPEDHSRRRLLAVVRKRHANIGTVKISARL
jgi:hypothetical protein